MFLKEVSDYYGVLAAKHCDVQHSRTNVAFCRYNDSAEFGQLRNSGAKTIIIIKSFFGKAAGEYNDAAARNHILLCVSCYAKNITSPEIVAASEKAFGILLDIWTRMRYDFEEDDCAWLKNVDWENIQFDEIEQPWLQNHYGWDFLVPYTTPLPVYEPSKWDPNGY